MKAVILCGGTGSRLRPLTLVTNKHLLPVYNKPMIYYPIQTLVDSGIRDILLVCGGNAAGEFLRVLGNGEEFGLKHLSYTYQAEPLGIAHALGLAEEWAKGEPICVMLGDNILENNIKDEVHFFSADPSGARIFVTNVPHPEWYGVVDLSWDWCVRSIVEKPKEPQSHFIAIGVYMYDSTVWEYIRQLKPSKRNELEITDLNNHYLSEGRLKAHRISGFWADAGESIDTYLDTSILVRDSKKGSK